MLDIGLIGAGGISAAHLPAYRDHPDDVRLAAVCDAVEDRARDVADEFDVPYWTDFEPFVAEADVDAVDVVLPHHLHYPAAKAALEAGKHVLVEKPFTTDTADALELVEMADERGLTVGVGQMQRYHPPYRAVKARVAAGDLGTIRHARCDALVNQGDMFPAGHWLYDGDVAGGGAVVGYSVHKLDLLRYYLGDVARAVSWRESVGDGFENGAEDYAAGLLEFESGARADFFATLSAPAMPYTESFSLYGDDGVVHTLPDGEQSEGYSGTPEPRINCRDDPDARKAFEAVSGDDAGLPTGDAFVNEILAFADAVESGADLASSGRDNVGTVAAIEAIYRSADADGGPVAVADVLADAEAEVAGR